MKSRFRNLEPLEISKAICNEVIGEVVALGKDRRIFPFTNINVELYAPDDKQQIVYEASFIQSQQLKNDIVDCLRKEGCSLPDKLMVEINIVREPEPQWAKTLYQLSYSKQQDEAQSIAWLSIIQGKAQKKKYQVTKRETFIGRCEEVKDKGRNLFQRNDIVFLDDNDSANSTVSRSHSRIEYDEHTREYRIFDTQSRHGIRIERQGKIIEVNGPRGVKLLTDDRIYFGQACARFFFRSFQDKNLPEDEEKKLPWN